MANTGRCLCGGVRYQVEGEIGDLVNCHCQFCRRAHGAAFATTALVATRDFHLLSGDDCIVRHGGRHFCRVCGTRLFNRGESHPGATSIVVASLDEDPKRPPVAHLNVESMARWYEILDGKAQYQAFPSGVDAALEAAAGGDE